jgi:hypothetical protein
MQILIPEWMLDEDRCRGMEIVERPSLAITALFALRETGRCAAVDSSTDKHGSLRSIFARRCD